MIYILPTDTCFGIGCALDDNISYHKIYDIKKRDLSKPLAIMVSDFAWLEKYTTLNQEQISFLKSYNKPFSVITECNSIKMILNLEQEDFEYKNKEIYEKFSFRVAHNNIQKKLIKEIGPIFLTSANISGEKEIYSIDEAKKQFGQIKNIQFLGEDILLDSSTPPSDIIEFKGESIEFEKIR